MLAARETSRLNIVFGAILTVMGIFAVLAPTFTGIATTALVGMLMLASGMIEIVYAVRAGSFGRGVLRVLFGGLTVLAGLLILATPLVGLSVLTIMLAIVLLVGGVVNITLALRQKSQEGWGWLFFGGLLSIIFGALIALQWPVSGLWAVGLYMGIRILMHGWILMALGRTGQETLTYLQDTRIEILERNVRTCARALQETQLALADHTATLLALDNQLRKKVSSSDVDPSLQELNKKVGEARKWMQKVTSINKESWDQAQQEASEVFTKLQTNVAEIAENLKQSLGLTKNENSEESQPSAEPSS
jgi:uncharacterized membrane protein HdeD (DUF308 family)